jgi:hypothetical protein
VEEKNKEDEDNFNIPIQRDIMDYSLHPLKLIPKPKQEPEPEPELESEPIPKINGAE